MERIYNAILVDHFKQYDQMAFLSGPRQVGKTTISTNFCKTKDYCKYLNWDITKDRTIILGAEEKLIESLPIDAILEDKPLIVFDEIHKYKHWKNYLKGFIDEYKTKLDILITGSAKLNIIRRGGDSLTGRYFLYRVHPLTVRELQTISLLETELSSPKKLSDDEFAALFKFGGFPEPFTKQTEKFFNRWQLLRQEQVLREDIKNGAQIHDLAHLEVLAELLKHQATKQVRYTELAKKIRIADTSIRRWITVLENYYYCFLLKPWTKNISRSLIKEPKAYLWDWSIIEDLGSKVENFVACHLLKAVHYWQDVGMGKYALNFIRDKEKQEVDFLITKNDKPWILIEVKTSEKTKLSRSLVIFKEQLKVPYAFQLAFDMPYVDKDCFEQTKPCIVSMRTFLSQLV